LGAYRKVGGRGVATGGGGIWVFIPPPKKISPSKLFMGVK